MPIRSGHGTSPRRSSTTKHNEGISDRGQNESGLTHGHLYLSNEGYHLNKIVMTCNHIESS